MPSEPDEGIEITPEMIDAGCSAFEKWFAEMALYGFFEGMPGRKMVEGFVAGAYSSMTSVSRKDKDEFPKAEAARRRDELARRVLNTPPTPREVGKQKPTKQHGADTRRKS